MEIRPDRQNEMQFLPVSGRIDTAIWMQYLDANKKKLEENLNGNYTRMLRALLNKSWWQHPTKHHLYGHLPPTTKTIQARRTRHAGHCRRSRDELISDVLLWTPTYGWAKAGRLARTYVQQHCEVTGCKPEDLPEAINDREKWCPCWLDDMIMMMMINPEVYLICSQITTSDIERHCVLLLLMAA